jgi:aryl-alcohol dehydrogenase-like predicted oxidoreductase
VVNQLKIIANAHHGTPAQIALAWLLAQKPWIVPIRGSTKIYRLKENLVGASNTLLAEDLMNIEQVFTQLTIIGARYPEQLAKMVGK